MSVSRVGTRASAPRRAPGLALLALVLCLAGVFGTGWVLRPRDGDRAEGGGRDAARGDEPAVVCIGQTDVEGGVTSLYPAVPGRVVEVPARENAPVRAGAVLLRLDSQAAQFAVQETEAAVRAAEARLVEARKAPQQHELLLAQQRSALAAAQHDLAASRLMARRRERLLEQKLISREEAEAAAELAGKMEAAAKAEREKLRALELRDPAQEVAQAEAELGARKALLGKARYALGECVLRAPADGTVLRVLVNPGEVLSPQPGQPVLLFCPDQPRIVRAEVDQEFAGRVAVGQRADIQDDADGAGPTWQGKVLRLADWYAPRRVVLPDALRRQDVRTLECIIGLDPGRPPPRIGQRVRIRLAAE